MARKKDNQRARRTEEAKKFSFFQDFYTLFFLNRFSNPFYAIGDFIAYIIFYNLWIIILSQDYVLNMMIILAEIPMIIIQFVCYFYLGPRFRKARIETLYLLIEKHWRKK